MQLCRFTTAGQLERLVRGVRRVRRIREGEADPERAVWRRRVSASYDADGDLVVSVRLPATEGAVLLAALEQVQAELDRERAERLPVADDGASAETWGTRGGGAGVAAETSGDSAAASRAAMDDLVSRTSDTGAGGSATKNGHVSARMPSSPRGTTGVAGDVSAETSPAPVAAPGEEGDLAEASGGVPAEDRALEPDRVSAAMPEPGRATLGEALLEIARRSLDRATPDRARRSRARLTAQIDPLSG